MMSLMNTVWKIFRNIIAHQQNHSHWKSLRFTTNKYEWKIKRKWKHFKISFACVFKLIRCEQTVCRYLKLSIGNIENLCIRKICFMLISILTSFKSYQKRSADKQTNFILFCISNRDMFSLFAFTSRSNIFSLDCC